MLSNAYVSWSLTSPRPIVQYLPQFDEHIVYWNGFVMTHAHALQLTLMPYGIYATPNVKEAITNRFKQLYAAGVFGEATWDNLVYRRDYYAYVKDRMEKHIREVTKEVDLYHAVQWLDITKIG